MKRYHISGIHHIAIRAKDFDATVRFYTKVLHFHVRHTWSLPQYQLKAAVMLKSADGGTFIEVFDNDADIAAQGRRAALGEEPVQGALLHLCLSVDNAKAAYEAALAAGATSCVKPATLFLGNPPLEVHNALVYSPNGEVIEFIEDSDL